MGFSKGHIYTRPLSWRRKISASRKKFYEKNPEEIPSGTKNPMHGVHRFGKDNPNFGKRWSEQKKKETSKKRSGKNHYWYGKKHSISTKRKMVESAKRVKKTEKWREKMRKSALKRAKKQGHVSFNPKACEYFDRLNKEKEWNLQHAKNGGEIECVGYSLDAYDEKRNIVVEYDEPHHYTIYGNLKSKDKKRQNRIIKSLSCTFFRFNEREKTLKKII